MNQQDGQISGIGPASVGGTAAAMAITVIVLAIVAIVAGWILTIFNYYMSSMRIEAAGFFGAIFGGLAGVYASRSSCDAILKTYHKKAVFVLLFLLIVAGLYFEFIVRPVGWRTLTPVAQLAAIGAAAWVLFWNGADLDAL